MLRIEWREGDRLPTRHPVSSALQYPVITDLSSEERDTLGLAHLKPQAQQNQRLLFLGEIIMSLICKGFLL
jgi:hypothetical protein